MAKQMYQYRFGTEDSNMLREDLIANDGIKLPDGTILSDVEQISIETIPGVIFYINGVETQIGITGIYEINFKEKAIYNLYFSEESVDLIETRSIRDKDKENRNTKTVLLINVVYGG